MKSTKSDPKSVSPVLLILILVCLGVILAGLFLPALAKAKAKAASRQFRWDPSLDLAAIREGPIHTEGYSRIVENSFLAVAENPLSTFSIDVDTASYANIRRFLKNRTLPPKDAVRIEEMLNYFPYRYPPPTDGAPFAVHVELGDCPWALSNRLLRIGVKGREIERTNRAPANLVFLIDVSGSMEPANKLPLLVRSLEYLVEQLTAQDSLAIVVYAGSSGLALDCTPGHEKKKILAALRRLSAGGSTNGGQGIELAYLMAARAFRNGGINRVILCTDGDFNVGITSQGELIRLIQDKAKSRIFLTVLGFGMGNYKDDVVERLADSGNGNYAYIDSLREARKVLVDQLTGTLITIAKDVKIQVEFNPVLARAYRLIGYENRLLSKEDFNDDKKDAGEIGAGHTVTALYEIIPAGTAANLPSVDPLRYQKPSGPSPASQTGELATIKLRFKAPEGDLSERTAAIPVADSPLRLAQTSADFRFAGAVAAFGMLLRDSECKGSTTFETVVELARPSSSEDPGGWRSEFLELVEQARALRQ